MDGFLKSLLCSAPFLQPDVCFRLLIRAIKLCTKKKNTRLVEIDLRQLSKQQTTARHHQAWAAQRQVKRAIQDIEDVEWRSTLAYVHDRRAVFTFYSSNKEDRKSD